MNATHHRLAVPDDHEWCLDRNAASTHEEALLTQALFHADHTDRDLGPETEHDHRPPEVPGHHELTSPTLGVG